ncbi:hypothetical protein [Aeromonas enteropelogenes]|uniref:hypothetical protein n=1 Tax=Aeromonas enteropelogenes TaxID=29489 RepID=UPI0022859DAB|nr:hypothetical protein [Aeromonas enteropelogenes]MCZ0752592.1 hypothetical protein [Aeromonas enteropelogenes]
MRNLFIIVMLSVMLAGCASEWGVPGGKLCDSEMLNIGPDTYVASGKYGGCGASYKVKHAGIFCQREGKEVLVTNIDDSMGGQVIFKCLPPGDKDLKRPTYGYAPGVTMDNQ